MVKYFNQKVAEKEPIFKVGDWVMVNAKKYQDNSSDQEVGLQTT